MPLPAAFAVGAGMIGGSVATNTVGGATSPWTRGVIQVANAQWENEIPGVEQILQAWRSRTITQAQAIRFLSWHGVDGDALTDNNILGNAAFSTAAAWRGAYTGSQLVPSPGETIVLLNRNKITEEFATSFLRHNGATNATVMQAYRDLGQILPSPSDLVSFALREAWDRQVVQRFQYDAEFPQEMAFWMDRQGANGDARTDAQKTAGDPPVNWSQLYWRVHWANLAPTQAYEMFQRLRPSRIAKYADTFPGIRSFTLADLRAVLKINDYPLPFRDQLAAIAYRTPRLLDVQRYYATGIIDKPEVEELHQDMGFAPDEAARRADFVVEFSDHQTYRQAAGNLKGTVLAAYELGTITAGQAAERLFRYFYYGYSKWRRWEALPQAARQQAAQADAAVLDVLVSVDDKIDLDEAKFRVSSIHRGFKIGIISQDQATNRLREAGVTVDRTQKYIRSWNFERRTVFVYYSTPRIQKLYEEGLMPEQAARDALSALGWDDAAVLVHMTESGLRINARRQKLAKSILLDSEKEQSKLMKIAKAAEAQRKAAIAELIRQARPAQLKRRYVRGVITELQLREELAVRGYQGGYIDQFLAEAIQDRADELLRRCKEKPCPPNAPGATSTPTATQPKTPPKAGPVGGT